MGFVGGSASSLVLADFADNAPPTALAALRMSIVTLGVRAGRLEALTRSAPSAPAATGPLRR
jgi:hypothetical protein